MSNRIPEMDDPDEFPYCIWYPETASEATYRALAVRYPQMKYQIGRACAVAGYVGLFGDLDLLPECHIAEEARENQQWEIYDAIMKADVRYNAMDDYTRTVFSQPSKGYLNGDTAVRSYLDIKTEFKAPPDWDDFPLPGNRRQGQFDIAEDDPINARFIMNNDLSRITPETTLLPYCIWYPSVPHPSTCKELFRRLPSMKPAIAKACILADYPETWDFLDVDPDENLMMDARQSHNPKYLRDLESKLPERGCAQYPRGYTPLETRAIPRHDMFEPTLIGMISPNVTLTPSADIHSGVPYNGRCVSMAHTELTVGLPDELQKLAKELWDRDYTAIEFDDKYYASLVNKNE
ncbi:hypothetical protein ASPVEDRAFT_52724 [Aspergillus versicolor CBS 583.65]|uniref:Uncharacterized protein n=1 Tax=Aspergillus versicolor CBS 583.65 TaxID=1036611 RepID=A0A1L9PK37_ASPVE|nr:uncharacterized protein ASPVEDRAFT_52724 [Aspergillus versicolor CBS 583.65]OJJ01889.1 hypothetical protein ASPVEDRAFT_52724 [Aspergillus versicolor CBS 583.65]